MHEPDRVSAEQAAGEWFWEEMEMCPACGDVVPWDELEALIGTRPICFDCRVIVQQRRYSAAHAAALEAWPLAWYIGVDSTSDEAHA